MPGGYARVLRCPRMVLVLAGLACSQTALGLVMTVNLVVVVGLADPSGAPLALSLLGIVGLVPGVLVAAVAGRKVGGFSGGALMAADGLLRMACLGLLAVAGATGRLGLVMLLVLIGCSSFLSIIGSAGQYLVVAEVLEPRDHAAGNALITTVDSVALILGPALAGFLIEAVEWWVVYGVCSLGFVFLVLCLVLARQIRRVQVAAGTGGRGASAGGLALLLRRGRVRRFVVLNWAFNFIYGPLSVALPVVVLVERGQGAIVLGFLWSAFGAGAVLGGLLAGIWNPRSPFNATCACMVVWGLSLLPLLAGAPDWFSILAFGLGGLAYAPVPVMMRTVLQREVPTAELGPVAAAWGSISASAEPAGTALGGPLVVLLGGAGGLLAVAAGAWGGAAIGFTRWRGRR